jgi:very-short-patch-repair endonuclease
MSAEQLQTQKQKLTQIFSFLKSFDALQKPIPRDIALNPEVIDLSSIPKNVNLRLNLENNTILRVRKPARPILAPCPSPAQELHPYLEPGWEDPKNEIELARAIEAPELIESLKMWERNRLSWKSTALEEQQIYDIADRSYNQAFRIYTTLGRDSEDLELVLADIILRCPNVNYPLVFQKLEIELDDTTSDFVFELSLDGPRLNEVLLNETAEIKENIRPCVELIQSMTLYPVVQEVFDVGNALTLKLFPKTGEFFANKTLVHGQNGVTEIVHRPYILLRKKTEGYGQMVSKILDHIIEADDLPGHLLQITGLSHKGHQEETNRELVAQPSTSEDQIYLSKESNQEQIRIAHALERSSGVLVQGPPGTGKTHTIANLVGHFLSKGKTVLVTAQTSKALDVLRDKVDESLQSLCISVLDKDTSKLTSQSTTDFVTTLNRIDPWSNVQRAASLDKQRQELFARKRTLQSDLRKSKIADEKSIVLDGQPHQPLDLAKELSAKPDQQWIRTPVPLDEVLPLSQHEIEELYYSNQRLSREAQEQLSVGIPRIELLISPEGFSLAHTDGHSRPASAGQIEVAQVLAPLIAEERERLSTFADWQITLIRKATDSQHASLWTDFLGQSKRLEAKLAEANRIWIEHDLHLPSENEFEALHGTLTEIQNHLERRKSLGIITRWTKPRWVKALKSFKIDGKDPTGKAEIQKIFFVIEAKTLLVTWTARALRQFESIQGSLPLAVTCEEDLAKLGELVSDALCWRSQRWNKISDGLDALNIRWQEIPIQNGEVPKEILLCQKSTLSDLVADALHAYRISSAIAQLSASKALLNGHLKSEISTRLLRALETRDKNSYTRCYKDLLELSDLVPSFERRTLLLSKLAKSAPNWRADIIARSSPHAGPSLPGDAQTAWMFAKFRQAIEELEAISPEAIEEGLATVNQQIRKVTAQIVELRAWAQQKRKVTTEHTQALAAYTTTLSKLGKGLGKLAVQKKREAQNYLRKGKEAFPVWIMPLSRVYESFDPSTTKFDVVIIDEASQSDLRALAAIYMAKQIVIVGDKEQVTPRFTPGAQGISALQNLISTHLKDIPNKSLYETGTSIYEIVEGSFDTIPLREHFRCLPPIIQFCSDLSYNNKLLPLRDPQSLPIGEPLIPYQVRDGCKNEKVNEVEAQKIASLLLTCLKDPNYDVNDLGHPTTYGVISLGGADQARKIDTILHESITPLEFKKRKIICGEPYDLQGDERDVIFISLVDGPESIRKKSEEGHNARERRKFNVAVSRARNQLWVVYSMDPEKDLETDDIRYKLIRYVQNPESTARARKKAESVFEEEIQAFLIRHGYKTDPQYEVGGRFIDMVVSDGDKKLAIECDGERWHGEDRLDEDLERQAILERMGWKFHRIRGISYFRNREKEFRRLIEKLVSRNIQPSLATTEV